MIILSIDTSCDDTSIAVLTTELPRNKEQSPNIKVLSNIVSSQVKIHAPYGGVYPALAKREHQRNLAPALKKALGKARLLKSQKSKVKSQNFNPKVKILKSVLKRDEVLLEKTINFLEQYEKPKIDAIAITNTPGLEPCLWQGVNFAKALCFWWNLPVIPVNHIKAHLSANFINRFQVSNFKFQDVFPAVGLVASGGHTELVYMPEMRTYKIIGSTRDDAAGECFDKTARILGLPYPGGPAIANLAMSKLQVSSFKFQVSLPRPMINSHNYDFSFSGLKTAVLYNFQSQKKSVKGSQNYKIAMAKEIQQAIIDVLIAKTTKAATNFNAKSIIAGGGVMANKELRKQFKAKIKKEKISSKFYVPSFKLCMDNAVMVGVEAIISGLKTASWQKVKVNGNLNI